MLLIVIALTLFFTLASTQLSVTMRWSDLLPQEDPRTVQFNKIVDDFKTSTSLTIIVQGEEEDIKKFADELAPRIIEAVDQKANEKIDSQISKLEAQIEKQKAKNKDVSKLENQIQELLEGKDYELFQRVDYRLDMDFMRDHAMMLIKKDDLENLQDIFFSPNLNDLLTNYNNAFEKEYIGREESISTREKEDGAVATLDGIDNFLTYLQNLADGQPVSDDATQTAVDKLLFGDPYFLSYDQHALAINAIPTFELTDIALVIAGVEAVDAIIAEMAHEYPDVEAGSTGFLAIARDEMVYSEQSLGVTSLIAVIAIFFLLVISFRMWTAPLLALFTLLIGTIWAIGAAALVVGQLNIMTQMMTVILFGLGIDFSIHLISGFTERRAAGDTILEAMEQTFLKSGKGVLTGALTTALAFLTLIVAHSRGMKEMGLVTGFGLLAILLATFLMLPSLMVFRERRLEKKRESGKTKAHVKQDISFGFLGNITEKMAKNYGFTILSALLITILMLWFSSQMTFDSNYMNIEPEGLTSIALQDTVMDKFDLSMDFALITADSPEESQELVNQYKEFSSVAMVEDISNYLPSSEQQQQRIPLIEDIRAKMSSAVIQKILPASGYTTFRQELERLQFNIIEMQDMAFIGGQDKVDDKCKTIVGNPDDKNSVDKIAEFLEIVQDDNIISTIFKNYQKDFAPRFKESVLNMCHTEEITLNDLPDDILDQYSNDNRDKFLVTVYPAGSIWQDAQFLNQFSDDMESVTNRATGMPVVFRALIQVIGSDGKTAMLFTVIIVFILLWIDFGKPGYALLALLPLAIGVIWMIGLMYLTRQQFTVMNVMGLPMILGIGIDDGVHAVHRWISEGRKNLYTVFSSTGKAILLTSLTTMLAFGSLIFSIWRGFGQLGAALFVGVAACFLATVIVLPGIIGVINRNREI
jgi:predicted RND superfamily exporter protein